MNDKFYIECPMCSSRKYQTHKEHFEKLEDIGEGKEFKCNNCGFKFNELSYIQQAHKIKSKY